MLSLIIPPTWWLWNWMEPCHGAQSWLNTSITGCRAECIILIEVHNEQSTVSGTEWIKWNMEAGVEAATLCTLFLYKRGHCFCFCVILSELNGHQKWDWTMHGKIKYSHLEVHQSISPKYIVFSPSPQTYCFSFVLFWKSSGHVLSVVYQEK